MGGYVAVQGIELEIGRGEEPDSFRVRILRSRDGGTPGQPLGLTWLASWIGATIWRMPAWLRVESAPATGPDEKALREIGQQLFEAIFSGSIGGDYRASRAAAGGRLQVALHITAPELAALPWETMWDPATSKYVCLDEPPDSPCVRTLRTETLRGGAAGPFLGLVAAPVGLPMLNVRAEQEIWARHWPVRSRWARRADLAPDASWRTIHELLLGESWNDLHFIGHGTSTPGMAKDGSRWSAPTST